MFHSLRRLLQLRRAQPAFHPNATQFTLHLGTEIFAFWRQSQDRSQSIFCLSNVASGAREINLSDINLIGTDNWRDLISGRDFTDLGERLELAPYQSLWLSNRFDG